MASSVPIIHQLRTDDLRDFVFLRRFFNKCKLNTTYSKYNSLVSNTGKRGGFFRYFLSPYYIQSLIILE